MLKTLRENFKHLKWVLWVVIAVFVVFVFVDWGMGSATAARDTETAVVIGSRRVSRGEFLREYQAMENRYRQMFKGNFTPEMMKSFKLADQVMNGMIDRELMKHEAESLGIKVSDVELRERILSLSDSEKRPIFLQNGGFVGEDVYRRILAANNQTPAQFEADLRQQIVLEKLNRLLTESVFVSDDEVEADYAGKNVQAQIEYVLRAQTGLTAEASISDADIEAAFKKDPNAWIQPERRKAKYLLVEKRRVASEIVVPEAELQAEYNNSLESFKVPEQVHARHILYKTEKDKPETDAAAKAKADAAVAKLKGGADFAVLAKAESEDPGSGANGGDLGSFGRGQMVKPFEEAAFAAEPNQIVGPVKSDFGYHVIQVLQHNLPQVRLFPDVKEEIRRRLQDQRSAERVTALAADLKAKLEKLGKTPTDDQMRALTTSTITFNETELFARKDNPAGIPTPKFGEEAFKLEAGRWAGPVSIPASQFPMPDHSGEAFLKVVEVKKPGVPALEEVKGQIRADLDKKRQGEAAVAALKAAMDGSASLDEIAKKLGGGAKVEKPAKFPKAGPVTGLGNAKEVLQAAFSARIGEMTGPLVLPGRGAVVLTVTSRDELDRAKLEKEKDQLRASLRSQKGSRLIQALLAKRRAETRIETNKELLERIGG